MRTRFAWPLRSTEASRHPATGDRRLPSPKQFFALIDAHLWLKHSLRAPEFLELVETLKKARRQTGQIRRAERRGFNIGGTHQRRAQYIGLKLHQEIIRGRPAI